MKKNFRIVVENNDNPAAISADWANPTFENVETYSDKDIKVSKYISDDGNVVVITETQYFEKVSRMRTKVKNNGSTEIKINRISSAYFGNMFPNCFAGDRIVIHYCVNAWQGEGRWKSVSLREFGLEDVTHHGENRTSVSIGSIGSWSTSRYYPLIIIEDTKSGETYFFEHEGGFSWEFEFGVTGHGENCCLCVEVNSANENQSGFFKMLGSNEEYVSSFVLSGKVYGGFEMAVQVLTEFKQKNINTFSKLPVCFNDFMNCLWACPNYADEISLIDAAADAGAEIYCIDDGWFVKKDGTGFGDWKENNLLFGDTGLAGIINYIIKKGMKPGIWIELETCMPNSKIYNISKYCLLKRNGRVIGEKYSFLNMSDNEVRQKLLSIISHLYSMGIRYIKNDYNHSVGIGCENYSDSFAYGLIQNTYAFYSFIDEIKQRYPDIIIENCGSGAMRCDWGTLSHFDLQSISDQENFLNNPTIIQGISACIPPEKCGIWSTPYPIMYDDKGIDVKDYHEKYEKIMADGNQTVYNMCCSMFGVMMLSGRIDYCDEYNVALIKSGIKAYKKIRDIIRGAVPIYPEKQKNFDDSGYNCLGLYNKKENKIIIGIFKNSNQDNTYSIDLSKWINERTKIEPIYCKKNITATLKNCIMSVETKEKISAGVFMLSL